MLLRSVNTPQGIKAWKEKLDLKRARVLEQLAEEQVQINTAKIGAIQGRIAMIQDLEHEVDELRSL